MYTKSVYNGHVSLSGIDLSIERSMVIENIFLDMRWIIIDVVYPEYSYVVHGTYQKVGFPIGKM